MINLLIRKAAPEEIYPLRWNVLIIGTARESAEFPGDQDPAAKHYAAFMEKRMAGCVSLMPSEWEGKPAWQLRGMAVDEAFRGQRIGASLHAFLIDDIQHESPRLLWCNARQTAVNFYLKMGWKLASEEFEYPGVGLHFKMVFALSE